MQFDLKVKNIDADRASVHVNDRFVGYLRRIGETPFMGNGKSIIFRCSNEAHGRLVMHDKTMFRHTSNFELTPESPLDERFEKSTKLASHAIQAYLLTMNGEPMRQTITAKEE